MTSNPSKSSAVWDRGSMSSAGIQPILKYPILALASCGFLSYLPPRLFPRGSRSTGSGLIGSLAGVLTAAALPVSLFHQLLFLLGGVLVAVAVSDWAERWMGMPDDARIVIDEWIGCLIAVAFLPPTPLYFALGFVLFRIFDVIKKPWIGRLGDLPGGWGVVMDDVGAGLYANGLLQLLHWILEKQS